MRKPFAFLAAAVMLSGLSSTPAFAQSRDEQQQARKDVRSGHLLSLREIERMVLPKMRGHEYLGPSYDPAAMAYRLKFIRDGKVVFIDVDARTGRVLARSR